MGRVRFVRNSDCIPAAWASAVETTIAKVLADRHEDGYWAVSHRESLDGHHWDLEFTSGSKSETLRLEAQQADPASDDLALAAREFVAVNWCPPGR